MAQHLFATMDTGQLRTMTSGDADLAAEALGIFRSQAELWSRLLDASAEPCQWADACHTIKGAARSVGAIALAEACSLAETLGRSQGPISRARAAVALSDVKDRMTEALEAAAALEHQLLLSKSFNSPRLPAAKRSGDPPG